METRDASWCLSKERWTPNSLYLKVFEEALGVMRKLDICSIYGVNKRFRKSWKTRLETDVVYIFRACVVIFGKGKTHSGTNRIYIITSVNRGEPGLVNLD